MPGDSAVAMLYEFKQPGVYVYLSHNLIEAIMLGAAAHVYVEGDWDDDLMEQLQEARPISSSEYIWCSWAQPVTN